jgi:hypothetical protein
LAGCTGDNGTGRDGNRTGYVIKQRREEERREREVRKEKGKSQTK